MIIHLKNFKIPYYPPLTSSISIYSIFGRDIITFVLWEPSPSDWYHGWPLDYPDRISLSHSGPPQSAYKVRLIQYHWFEYHPVTSTVSLGVVHKLHLQNLDNFDHASMSVDTFFTLIEDRNCHFFNHVCTFFCKHSL